MDVQQALFTSANAINWEAVYWQWMPRIYNFFRYQTGDDTLAEDLTATTFAKAWRFRDRYSDDVGAFSTWLFTIARNVSSDHFHKKRPETPLSTTNPLSDDGKSLDEHIQHQLEFAHLGFLLNQLPPRERELIAFKYGAEMTNRAIAQFTGMSESNVGTSLHRIIQKLRLQWDEKS